MEPMEEAGTGSENGEEEHVDRLLVLLPDPARLGRRLMPSEWEPQAEGDVTGKDRPAAEAAWGRSDVQRLRGLMRQSTIGPKRVSPYEGCWEKGTTLQNTIECNFKAEAGTK